MHLMQRDLSHLGLAAGDVGAQQHRSLVAALALVEMLATKSAIAAPASLAVANCIWIALR